jgi:hypothetical protein
MAGLTLGRPATSNRSAASAAPSALIPQSMRRPGSVTSISRQEPEPVASVEDPEVAAAREAAIQASLDELAQMKADAAAQRIASEKAAKTFREQAARDEAEAKETAHAALETEAARLKAELQAAQTALEAHASEKVIAATAIPKWMTAIVKYGTIVVLSAVGILVCVGGAWSAHYRGGLPWVLAILIPAAVEAGAAIELTSLLKHRLEGTKGHWTSYLLAGGLLLLSIAGMVLHAKGLSDAENVQLKAGGSLPHHAWAIWLAVALPLELALVVRAALPSPKKHPLTKETFAK